MNVKWTVNLFWAVLAVLYLVLAVASFLAGQQCDKQLAMVAQGGYSVQAARPRQPIEVGPMKLNREGDVVVADLLPDLRAYLGVSTWVNGIGFFAAAAAAVATGWKRLGAMAETPSSGA